jgi:hypothetical protein
MMGVARCPREQLIYEVVIWLCLLNRMLRIMPSSCSCADIERVRSKEEVCQLAFLYVPRPTVSAVNEERFL